MRVHTENPPAEDATIQTPGGEMSELNNECPSSKACRQTSTYFILTVLGFSFWFLMAVPFASHKESYWWLARVHSQTFARAFSIISTVHYRPLGQVAAWLGFLILDPRVFPTNVVRQALLQGFIYGMFVFAWWFIYRAAPQRRLFALVAFLAGCAFFSGYIHLFHIYGLFYVPVVLTLGALIRFHSLRTPHQREVWCAAVATLLVFWHQFAPALFVAFYFGHYLDTFKRRTRAQHVQAVAILVLVVATLALAPVVVAAAPRFWREPSPVFLETATMPLGSMLFGFLVSYETNEVNRVASLVAFLLTQMVAFSMGLSRRLTLAAAVFISALSVAFLLKGLPILLLWVCAVLIKLGRLRCWRLFFLALTADLFPFGGGIGTPIYALFAIIVAVYVTPLGWSRAETALSFVNPRYVIAAVVTSTIVLAMVRGGIAVPLVTRVASPLVAERERTYQLEKILAWLHNSNYCGYEVGFVEDAGNPIDSVESAVTRRNRPPAGLKDVQLFWSVVLQCRKIEHSDNKARTAVVTFGGPTLTDLTPVFEVSGSYAGDATVWVEHSQN